MGIVFDIVSRALSSVALPRLVASSWRNCNFISVVVVVVNLNLWNERLSSSDFSTVEWQSWRITSCSFSWFNGLNEKENGQEESGGGGR